MPKNLYSSQALTRQEERSLTRLDAVGNFTTFASLRGRAIFGLMDRRFLMFAWIPLLLTVSYLASAQQGQQIVPVDSVLYDYLDLVAKESGTIVHSDARPFSLQHMQRILDDIDHRQLSSSGQEAYRRIREYTAQPAVYQTDGLRIGTEVMLGLEAYPGSEDKESKVFGYNQRTPVLNIPLDISVANALTLYADFSLQEELFAIQEDPQGWNVVNLPADVGYFDYQLPFRAYASAGGDFWNVQLGRDRLSVGTGNVHQLELSSNPHFFEFIAAKLFWKDFSYTSHIINLEPLYISGETKRSEDDAYKTYLSHRFEMRFFDRLLLSITEGTLIGGVPIELKHLNPLMVFHSFTDWTHASALFSVELSVNPWKYLELYAQTTWNQIQLAYEKDVYNDDAMPNAMGYMLGMDWDVPLSVGILSAGAEWVYADPWLYVRETPLVSYHWRRRIFSNIRGNGKIINYSIPMGYTWGPDSTSLSVWAGINLLDHELKASLHYEHAQVGEQTIDSGFETGDDAVRMRTPTGTPEVYNILRADLSWAPVKGLNLILGAEVESVQNRDHQSGQNRTRFLANLGATISVLEFIDALTARVGGN